MAKKVKKIQVKDKLQYKKPLKNCEPALDDIRRIRNNEQAKLRRLKAKFEAINPRKKGGKKEADKLRKEIKAYERGIDTLKGTIGSIRTACDRIADNKAQVKSLKLKAAAIDRKLKKAYDNRDFTIDHKKLQNEILKLRKQIKGIQVSNNDVLYSVNKKLGFDPETIAERLDIRPGDLRAKHEEDFSEDFWDEQADIEAEKQAEREAEELEREEEEEVDEKGYLEELDDVFWQVSQDFTRNESNNLSNYDYVTISHQGGRSVTFPGSSGIMISLKFDELVRWCSEQSTSKGMRDSAARITKSVTMDGKRLKYYGYIDKSY